MTDSPFLSQPVPRPTLLDQCVTAFGNAARPFAIYLISAATSGVILKIGEKIENGNDGAIFIGAVGVIMVGIYVGKSVENWQAGKQAANVEIARVTGAPPTPAA